MIYLFLFLIFLFAFSHSVTTGKDNRRIALFMGFLLFALVAFRGENVGPDTWGYIQLFLDQNYRGVDRREMEGFYLGWMSFWRTFHLSGQLYLIVCAIFSIGLVLVSMWRMSKNRIWTYTLFLVVFSWYFYLSGIRQALAIGCFTFGTYLLSRNINDYSNKLFKTLFRKENYIALTLLVISPLFHTTALFADLMLIVAFLSPKNKEFYKWAILISFVICLTAVFKEAELLLQRVFNMVSVEIDMASRYEGYIDQDYLYDTSFYLVLKSALPFNFIAYYTLSLCKREYDIQERLFLWMIIFSNLFFYFPYAFRLKMYFYPASCVAIANMVWPLLNRRKFSLRHAVILLFIVLETYVNYVNLEMQDTFRYKFFFY